MDTNGSNDLVQIDPNAIIQELMHINQGLTMELAATRAVIKQYQEKERALMAAVAAKHLAEQEKASG
jgi:hypothetical protein